MKHTDTRHIIIGCGAQCKYILDIFSKTGAIVETILDPIGRKVGHEINGLPIQSFNRERIQKWLKTGNYSVIIGISDNLLKRKTYKLLEFDVQFENAIHPAGVISTFAVIGRNVIINSGAIIQPFATIGNGVMVHANVIVEHDNHIADFVNLAPGVILAGGVKVGEGTTIYSGAVVAPNVSIGANTIVGAGSLVLNDLADNIVAYGAPAKYVRKRD